MMKLSLFLWILGGVMAHAAPMRFASSEKQTALVELYTLRGLQQLPACGGLGQQIKELARLMDKLRAGRIPCGLLESSWMARQTFGRTILGATTELRGIVVSGKYLHAGVCVERQGMAQLGSGSAALPPNQSPSPECWKSLRMTGVIGRQNSARWKTVTRITKSPLQFWSANWAPT